MTLFSEATFEKMIAPQTVSAGLRGLVWDKRSGSKNRPWNMTPRAIGHGGWTGTSVWIDPSLDLFVVVLGNRRHPFGKTPNIYPTAARVGVIAVNAVRRESSGSPKSAARSPAALKGTRVALIVDEAEIGRPGGLPARLKNDGVEIAALFYPDESKAESEGMTYQVVPKPLKTDDQTGAPVYALTRDCPRVLPPAVHGARRDRLRPDGFEGCVRRVVLVPDQRARPDPAIGVGQRAEVRGRRPTEPAGKETRRADGPDRQVQAVCELCALAREQGLSFGEIARRINGDQMLGVDILECRGMDAAASSGASR